MSFAYKDKTKELKENEINVNEDFKAAKRGGETKSLRDLLIQYELKVPTPKQVKTTEIGKPAQNSGKSLYLANEIAEKLDDQKSLACFRTIAKKVPEQVIYEVISSIKETARDGKIKKSRGALFVNIIQSYCQDHQINLGF